jgi:2-deoxy-D-gluconate 3-dehydrogenase
MVPLCRGKIINFGSLLTFQGGLTVPAYAAAKGALGQLTKALSNEWSQHNVQVNAICPGYIETDMCVFLCLLARLFVSLDLRPA